MKDDKDKEIQIYIENKNENKNENNSNTENSNTENYVTVRISDKKRFIAIIFCLIGWLGISGLHRFYVGKIGTGILFLFTFGVFGIGTIIDLIKLVMEKFKDKSGAYLKD